MKAARSFVANLLSLGVAEIWLMRHGESLGNLDGTHGDSSLSAAGVVQAKAVAAQLTGMRFSQVYASPLLRARETAGLALPAKAPIIDARLREFEVQKTRFFDGKGPLPTEPESTLESGQDFRHRVESWLAEARSHPRVLAFTHFGVIRALLFHAGHRDPPQTINYCEIHKIE